MDDRTPLHDLTWTLLRLAVGLTIFTGGSAKLFGWFGGFGDAGTAELLSRFGIAGVLVVFSFLIIPAACSVLFAERFGSQLVVAWGVAVITTVAGLLLSAVGDLPTGSSLVSCFGAALVISIVLRKALKNKSTGAV